MALRRMCHLATTATLLTVCAAPAAAQTAPPLLVGAFPQPGSPVASPQTQISLRGATPQTVGTVTVTGSVTGAHPGQVEAWSDGRGVSFVPDKPFATDGETVTVQTDLPVANATDGDYTFTVNRTPDAGLSQDVSKIPPDLLKALTGQQGTVKGGDPVYKTEPDLRPPRISIFTQAAPGVAPGYVFLAPELIFGADRPDVTSGPVITDNKGQPVYVQPSGENGITDFRTQTYKGKPVLTWWEGKAVVGIGQGVVKLADEHYKVIKTVQGGNGYQLDLHEARLTPQGTLLAIVYNPVSADLTSVGGSANARAVDTVVQEIDIATGLVELEWHSVGNIPFDESMGRVGPGDDVLDDYVHGNSASLMNDGSVLLSGRTTWTAYKLDRSTGALLARFGGKRSSYAFVGDARFAWQHDVEQTPDGSLKLFDNEGAPQIRDQSRALTLTIDDQAKTLAVKQAFAHTPALQSGTQGDVQLLPNGNLFTEWGSQGFFTEFSPTGEVLLDGYIARGQDTYRGYRFPWVGTPRTKPKVALDRTAVYVSWNGATEVAKWRLLTGSSSRDLTTRVTRVRKGFETRIRTARSPKVVQVVALSASGKVLGSSKVVRR